jgi:hypothetical protein
MAVPGVEQVGERPLEELVVALAREQLDVLRLELTSRAGRAAPGLALVGGGGFLAALASGTGTASLILLLARRPGPSVAALGVTAAYAGAGAFLAREGLARLRDSGLPDAAAEDEPAKKTEEDVESAERRTRSAAKSAQRVKSPTKSRPQPSARRKVEATSRTPRRRASGTQTERRRGS